MNRLSSGWLVWNNPIEHFRIVENCHNWFQTGLPLPAYCVQGWGYVRKEINMTYILWGHKHFLVLLRQQRFLVKSGPISFDLKTAKTQTKHNATLQPWRSITERKEKSLNQLKVSRVSNESQNFMWIKSLFFFQLK